MKRTPLRLGLVGADAAGRGWGPAAHIPALRANPDIQLAAVCTSRPASAAAAAAAFGVAGFHDVEALVASPDIDAIACVVRLPAHREVVSAALRAGKHVYCEWPLGVDLDESRELAALASEQGVVSAIGLQGRHDPVLSTIQQLHEEGFVGRLLSVRMTMVSGLALEKPSRELYEREQRKGVRQLTILGGHCLDYLSYCFGAFTEVSGRMATRVPALRMADTGEEVPVDSPDTMVVHGLLGGEAVASAEVACVPFHGDGWRMVAHGTEGTLVATTPVMPQITPIRLMGARGSAPLAELEVSAPHRVTSAPVPVGPAQNVAQAYVRFAEAIRSGERFRADFDDAVAVHELLHAIQTSSDEGRSIGVVPPR